MPVALLTCTHAADPDHDEKPLMAALAAAGVEARMLAWDQPDANIEDFSLCVIRSTWDYFHRPQEFLAWIAEAAGRTRLLNPRHVVEWNYHKRYLEDLRADGLPTVPTEWVPRGAAPPVTQVMSQRAWDEIVIKPAVSGGSHLTRRFDRDGSETAQAFLQTLSAQRDMMIQPYLPGVESPGEKVLIWIDGQWTHAVRKAPRFTGDEEMISAPPHPLPADVAVADAAIARYREELLYARIDLIPDERGNMLLSEVELIEPSLFLIFSEPALARMVDAIKARST